MLHEDPGNVSYSAVGGLSDQIRELRESIELPLMNPELFLRVGIKPPKVNSRKTNVFRFHFIHAVILGVSVCVLYFSRVFYSTAHQGLGRHY
jgi:hypothetical protein